MACSSGDIRIINPISNMEKRNMSHGDPGVPRLRKVIERQWELLPAQVQAFLLESAAPVDLLALAKFWSSPAWIEHTRCKITMGMSGASWLLAHSYLQLGETREARALLLNGSLLRQCTVSCSM